MDHLNTGADNENINIIVVEKYGYVVSCNCCHNLQFGFGNVSVDQCPSEFKRFAEIISGLMQKNKHYSGNENVKCISMPTPFPGFNMLFTRKELEQLNNLLQTALLILQVENLAN